MRRERYPLDQFSHLATRIEQGSLLQKNRHWTGNDEFERHYHIVVPRWQDPLYLHLSWKEGTTARPRFIGSYALHLGTLLSEGYIRAENDNTLRIRIVHGSDNLLYIQRRSGKPALAIGETPGE